MSLKNRVERLEQSLKPEPEFKIILSRWDRKRDGPWPETEKQRDAYRRKHPDAVRIQFNRCTIISDYY